MRILAIAVGVFSIMEGVSASPSLYSGGATVSEANVKISGSALLTRTGIAGLPCDLFLEGEVVQTDSSFDIVISEVEASGHLCLPVEFYGLPWTASIDKSVIPPGSASNVPFPVVLQGIGVNLCGAPFTVDASFINGATAGAIPNLEPSVLTVTDANLGSHCRLSANLSVANMIDDFDIYDGDF